VLVERLNLDEIGHGGSLKRYVATSRKGSTSLAI
jgi:hypothetical protein